MVDELLTSSDDDDIFLFNQKDNAKKNILYNEMLDDSTSDGEDLTMFASNIKRKKNAIVALESDSSSSDDVLLLSKEDIPKISSYIKDVVHEYTPERLRETFRVSRDVCYDIIDAYRNSDFAPTNNGGCETKTAEDDILSFLWFAGNKCCLRDVAERFGVSTATAYNQHNRVMKYLMHIAPNVIKFSEDLEEEADNFFQVSGFPDVIGCIDDSYMPIIKPAGVVKETYVNRHDEVSMTLQGICDSKRRFVDVYTGPSGRMHDARVFSFSEISGKLPVICGNRYHILGDGAYPLREYLLTPFRDFGNLTADQTNFNTVLSKTRILIENAFGILKMRFRQLFYGIHMHNPKKIAIFVVCCCVLHNLCIEDEFDFNIAVNENVNINYNAIQDEDRILRTNGEVKRNRLMMQIQ